MNGQQGNVVQQQPTAGGGVGTGGGMEQSRRNTAGLIGFVVALVGTCIAWVPVAGFVSTLGALVSLVAVRRRPRGFAVAGLIVGTMGTVLSLVVLTLAGAVAVGLAHRQDIATNVNVEHIQRSLEGAYERNGQYPATLQELVVSDSLAGGKLFDGWDNRFVYTVFADGAAYELISAGMDGRVGTEDDKTWRYQYGASVPSLDDFLSDETEGMENEQRDRNGNDTGSTGGAG